FHENRSSRFGGCQSLTP
ncbi:unnamed protein product, partial [Leptidea sinapis]